MELENFLNYFKIKVSLCYRQLRAFGFRFAFPYTRHRRLGYDRKLPAK